MYYLKKELEISASHSLKLSYESKCENLHGHNWIVVVHMKSEELNEDGMIYDFSHIKKKIIDKLDHKNLNDVLDFNSTAENMSRWICEELGEKCWKVDVEESKNNIASYERV